MLLTREQSENIAVQLPSIDEASPGSIEALKAILGTQQEREITYSEAQEIACSLVEFYQILAEEASDESTS